MNYEGTRQNVSKLIGKFGRAITLRKVVKAPPANPWETPTITEELYEQVGVAEPYSERLVNGTSILAGDFRLLLPGSKVTPSIGDRVTIGDETYNVVNVLANSPGGTTLMFTLQLRR